jgi:hypothetical protein
MVSQRKIIAARAKIYRRYKILWSRRRRLEVRDSARTETGRAPLADNFVFIAVGSFQFRYLLHGRFPSEPARAATTSSSLADLSQQDFTKATRASWHISCFSVRSTIGTGAIGNRKEKILVEAGQPFQMQL